MVVATDANCQGQNSRIKQICEVTQRVPVRTVCAVPDPHIERWLLVDSSAFRAVFGRGCDAPDRKCERARFKKMLIDAILRSGVTPSLGGIEFAADLVEAMNVENAVRNDHSLSRFLKDLTAEFEMWKT